MLEWHISEKHLPLQYSWKISRNTSDYKINFFVEVSRNGNAGVGEVAPNIRYQETPESIKEAFHRFTSVATQDLDLGGLEKCLDLLQLPASLRFGIESACVHLLCRERGTSVHEFFGLSEPGNVATSRSLPIMPASQLRSFWEQHRFSRFQILKVKVNRETAWDTLSTISRFTSQPLIVDANESWTDVDELGYFLKKIAGISIVAIEQPMPAGLVEEYKELKKKSPFALFADESITQKPDFDSLEEQFHGVNVKLMKAGGYLNGISQLKEARKRGMKTMLGCMVETSVGISSALEISSLADVADLDGFMILERDPFDLVTEKEGVISLRLQDQIMEA